MPRFQTLLESLVGKVGASEASRIQDYLGEHLASTGSARTLSGAAPSPPVAGCISRSVPTGPSCWDESTFGLVLLLFLSPPLSFYIVLYCSLYIYRRSVYMVLNGFFTPTLPSCLAGSDAKPCHIRGIAYLRQSCQHLRFDLQPVTLTLTLTPRARRLMGCSAHAM